MRILWPSPASQFGSIFLESSIQCPWGVGLHQIGSQRQQGGGQEGGKEQILIENGGQGERCEP